MKGVSLKKVFLALVVIGLFYASVTTVLGVTGASSVSSGTTSRYTEDSGIAGVSASAEAGNVTELNISGRGITTHWAGFYGEVTGNITLGNSDGDVFYDWQGLGTVAGEVFASNDSSVEWAGIGCADETEIAEIDTSLGVVGADPDGVEETYATVTAHPSFDVGAVTGISGCNATNVYTNNVTQSSEWFQVLLTDTSGDPVYTTLINDTQTGFDGATHDFQLLVGESDAAGSSSVYFYIELD